MVASLARQAVIIKSGNDTSVLTGNYELAYALGFLAKQTGIPVPDDCNDIENLREQVLKELEGKDIEDDKLKKLFHMVRLYYPSKELDGQMQELFHIGLSEKYPWDIHHM